MPGKVTYFTKGSTAVMLIIVVAVCAVVGRSWLGSPRRLAERLWSQTRTMDDQQAARHVEEIARLGTAATDVLVRAMADRRQTVALAAREMIEQQLDGAIGQTPETRNQYAMQLAESLADHADRFGPTAARWAEELTGRLLDLPMDAPPAPRNRFLAHCRTVLETTGKTSSPADTDAVPFRAPFAGQASLAEEENHRATDDFSPERGWAIDRSPLPGGNLAAEPVTLPSIPGYFVETSPDDHDATTKEPGRLEPQTPGLLEPIPARPIERQAMPDPLFDGVTALDRNRPTPGTPQPPVPLTTRQYVARLASPEPGVADSAAAELLRRGFGPIDFRLAELINDPDESLRLEAVESIPRLPDIDAKQWLIWFCDDPSPRVRLSVVGLLATNRDPEVQRLLKRMQQTESNLDVRELLRRAEQLHEQLRR